MAETPRFGLYRRSRPPLERPRARMPVVEVKFEVERNYDGWRLDRYLQEKIARLSRQRIQWIIKEKLRCDTRRLKPSSTVTPGLKFYLLKDVEDEAESDA